MLPPVGAGGAGLGGKGAYREPENSQPQWPGLRTHTHTLPRSSQPNNTQLPLPAVTRAPMMGLALGSPVLQLPHPVMSHKPHVCVAVGGAGLRPGVLLGMGTWGWGRRVGEKQGHSGPGKERLVVSGGDARWHPAWGLPRAPPAAGEEARGGGPPARYPRRKEPSSCRSQVRCWWKSGRGRASAPTHVLTGSGAAE